MEESQGSCRTLVVVFSPLFKLTCNPLTSLFFLVYLHATKLPAKQNVVHLRISIGDLQTLLEIRLISRIGGWLQ